MADHQTLGRDARNALRRAVVLWPSTDVPGGARRAIVGALDHAERGRWRAALAETSRAVSLARNLAERAALRRAINDALVSLRAIVGAPPAPAQARPPRTNPSDDLLDSLGLAMRARRGH